MSKNKDKNWFNIIVSIMVKLFNAFIIEKCIQLYSCQRFNGCKRNNSIKFLKYDLEIFFVRLWRLNTNFRLPMKGGGGNALNCRR